MNHSLGVSHVTSISDYFDNTYVNGTFRRVGNPANANGMVRLRNIPPLFPPETWNVHATTLAGGERTNNQTESWNNRFSNLVGRDHPTVWVLINKIRLELATDETKLQQHNLGALERKKKRPRYQILQDRLKSLCEEYIQNERSLPDFLGAIGHNIRFRPE